MQGKNLLFLVIWTFFILVPGPVSGETADSQIAIECSFNGSHSQIYEQMLERNASVGEYYEEVCPEFLENMPLEVRAHVYNTTMSRYRDLAADREFVPPLVRGKIAIATASPVISMSRVHIGLIGVGILTLLAVAWLVRQRLHGRKK